MPAQGKARMKILFYDMGSYTYRDFLYYLEQAGHHCRTVYYHFPDKFEDEFFENRFAKYLSESSYDAVVSVNFFPLVAKLCKKHSIKYLSWCYDSPLEERLKDYFSYETNYIFLFDRIEVESYRAEGYSQVFHLPLAVNTGRLDALALPPPRPPPTGPMCPSWGVCTIPRWRLCSIRRTITARDLWRA